MSIERWFHFFATASKPHFLDADPELLEKVEGLHPDRALHDVFVNFEAVSNS